MSFGKNIVSLSDLESREREILLLTKRVGELKEINATLCAFNVQEELNLGEVTHKDKLALDKLKRTALYGESVELVTARGDFGVGFYTVANLTLLVTFIKQEGMEGMYYLRSFSEPCRYKYTRTVQGVVE